MEGVGKKIKKFFKDFWYLLWKDNSLKGWILSLLFLFIFIKFLFFPLLSLATGTSLPLAIVESCSMHHQGNFLSNFENWWERHDIKYENRNIEKNDFEQFEFNQGFSKGDILFIRGIKPENIELGDIIIFDAGQQNPIIHRVIEIEEENNEYVLSTLGDNNPSQLSIEKRINENQIIGKAEFRVIPYLGWVKLIFYEHLRPAEQRGVCQEN